MYNEAAGKPEGMGREAWPVLYKDDYPIQDLYDIAVILW